MLSLTPTSASINLTQPEDSLPTDSYTVSLMLASEETQMCQDIGDSIAFQTTPTSIDFTDLSEFSVYNLTITVMNNAYRASRSSSFEFVTLTTCTYVAIDAWIKYA